MKTRTPYEDAKHRMLRWSDQNGRWNRICWPSEEIDENFECLAALYEGSTLFVLDSKHASAISPCFDLWEVVLDLGALPPLGGAGF